MPKPIACGGREQTFDMFQRALSDHQDAINILLVDSEEYVADGVGPWSHLKACDHWDQPTGTTDEHGHLMVQCMEAWIIADRDNLPGYFGHGFKFDKVPKWPDIQRVPKKQVLDALKSATKDSKKGVYEKGPHSFKVLACLDPRVIRAACSHAERFFATLDRLTQR